tara:strand:- start:2585 stop:3352 length:768 start_codon:yes stop_codon:yes gene_type:complete
MQAKKTKTDISDRELLRYNRHILLPEIDIDGQAALSTAKVIIVGLGGLGCPAATYLAASGIGTMYLVDDDSVSLSNLNRQVLYTENDISKKKVIAAKERLLNLNSDINIKTYSGEVNTQFDIELFNSYDVIIDCTDNFNSRALVNDIAIKLKIPLITGAALKFEGQIAVFRNDIDNMPCYRCLYSDLPNMTSSCVDSGILGSVTGFVGTALATECIKLICNFGELFNSKLFIIDLKNNDFKKIDITKDEKCKYCK